MATIFATGPGTVAVVGGDGDQPLPIAVAGISGSWYGQFNAILTEFDVQLAGNFQFTHTLSNVIYAYAFGDRISPVRIGGVAFSSGGCNIGGLLATSAGSGGSGIEALSALYANNKIANRPDPLTIQIGTQASGRFQGYMTGLTISASRPEARLSSFSFLFHVFPGDS